MSRCQSLPVLMVLVAASAYAGGVAKAVRDHHSFGVIREVDGTVSTRFAIVNTGDEPLVVLDARANCGCTTPYYGDGVAQPGDTLWVDVAYNPAGRPGRFEKKIMVDTNGEPSRTVFRISGSVVGSELTIANRYPYKLGPSRLQNRYVVFGDILHNESRGRYLEAYNAGPDTIRPVAQSSSKAVNVIVQPPVVPPGEQYIYSVVLSADKHGAWGPQVATFTVRPDVNSSESVDIEVDYNVKESFGHLTAQQLAQAPMVIFDDSSIDLGRIPATLSRPLRTSVKVSNRGRDPLTIRRVYTPHKGIRAGVAHDLVKGGKSTTLEIEIAPEAVAGMPMVDAEIIVITNDPGRPESRLRVVGEVVEI